MPGDVAGAAPHGRIRMRGHGLDQRLGKLEPVSRQLLATVPVPASPRSSPPTDGAPVRMPAGRVLR